MEAHGTTAASSRGDGSIGCREKRGQGMDGWREGGREGGGRSPDGIVAGGGVRQADDVASMRVPKHTVLLVVGVASESGVSLGGEAPVRHRGFADFTIKVAAALPTNLAHRYSKSVIST